VGEGALVLEDLLTVAEAAARARVSADHVRRAIVHGQLAAAALRSPGATRAVYRLRPQEVDRWLAKAGLDRVSASADPISSAERTASGTRTLRVAMSAPSTPVTRSRPANDSEPSPPNSPSWRERRGIGPKPSKRLPTPT